MNEDINLTINTEEFGVYGNALDLNHHLIGNELKVTKDNFTYTTGEMNLSGNTLNIAKDMLQNGGKINLDGGTINVGRDMKQHIGEIDLNGGKITVKRNLLQSHIMYINSGELDVGEDYYIAGTREIESDGTENITSSYGGCLKMVKETDIVRVGGDFLTYA